MGEMSDRGFISGFIGVGIHMTIQHILQDIHIANCCKKELADLKELVMGIDLTIMHIQQNLMAFKSGEDKDTASAVNERLGKLDSLLLDASKMVQRCSKPKSRLYFSGRPSKKEIWFSIKAIREHLELSPLLVRIPEEQVGIPEDQAVGDTQKVLEGLGKTKDSLESLASSATTSQAARKNLIVGQYQAFESLQKLVIDNVEAKKIGVLGKCGSGKTLHLLTLFNSQEVRDHFRNGLLLWVTVSQRPYIKDLCQQIAIQKKIDLSKAIEEEDEKWWLYGQLKQKQSSRSALFLDDVSEGNATELLDELGISECGISKIIVSSRDRTALDKMGVEDKYRVTIKDLMDFRNKIEKQDEAERDLTALPETRVAEEADSWQLFKQYAFPYNEDNLPPSDIVNEKARLVCDQCEGIFLAIKVVGRAMASSTHPQQWDWALHRLQNANSLDDYLRLSFDALGNDDVNMQLCFQHVAAAFPQDEIIEAQEVIPLWMGEGLLARKKLEHVPRHVLADHCLIEPMIRNTEGRPVCLRLQDPFEIGRLYLDLLAERCLIEPTARDADGHVLCFRMLKIVRALANPIAQHEDLPEIEIRESKWIFLSPNKLSSLPQFYSSSKMCSLLISQNNGLKKIPKTVIPTMLFLKVLDLSGTSALSLPKNVGCLKELRCLKLAGTKIKRLPKSLRDLGYLEILDVSFTDIEELPSDIHMLKCLRYLGLRGCKSLQYLPDSISSLLSLQYLYMDGCSMWTKPSRNRCKNVMGGCRKVSSLQSLGDLIQLKQLALETNGEQVEQIPLLKSMTEMDTLLLVLPEMVSLSLHISDMSKLRSLSLKCSKLIRTDPFIYSNLTETQVQMKKDVTHLKHLSYLKFYECSVLKEFQHLHKLPNLRQLEIILCPEVETFPMEFGQKEAFPSLKKFSLVGLQNLKGLPDIEGGAMPSLEIFTMMDCPNLRMPQSYLKLGSKIRIRLYGCPNANVNVTAEHMDMVQQVTEPINTQEIINEYLQTHRGKELYGECWCNGLFQYIENKRTGQAQAQ